VLTKKASLTAIADAFAERAVAHRKPQNPQEEAETRAKVRERCVDLIDTWFKLADHQQKLGVKLQYGTEAPNLPALLHGFLDEALNAKSPDYQKFRANRSMRDVEPNVDLYPRDLID
jgi:hypothetical protein